MAAPPTKETPILIGFLHTEEQYTYADDGVPQELKPIRASAVWVDYETITASPPAPAAWPGNTVGPVAGILSEPLGPAPGTAYNFSPTPPTRLSQVVPGNLHGGVYRPRLVDNAGTTVPYDPKVWIVDGEHHIVAFKYRTPTELGYVLPLNITFWSYVGPIAVGVSASHVEGVANEGAGAGAIYDATVANVAQLRTLDIDPAAAGIAISTPVVPGNVVLIGNTLTGANVGTGTGQVFSAKVGAALNFRSLAAGNGSAVTQLGDNITVATALTRWVVEDRKTTGTQGGGIPGAATFVIRTLNTITAVGANPGDVTLGVDNLTLTFLPGTYAVSGAAPMLGGAVITAHQVWFRIVGGATLAVSTSNNVIGTVTTYTTFRATLVFAVSTNVQVEHHRANTSTSASTTLLGEATGIGPYEVYTQLEITRVA